MPSPADDYAPLVENYAHDDDWDAPAAVTGVDVFAAFAPALGAAFEQAEARDERLYGFAEHQLSSYFVGTSTGLRRRFDQPDGRVELNAKSARHVPVGLGRRPHRVLHRRRRRRP